MFQRSKAWVYGSIRMCNKEALQVIHRHFWIKRDEITKQIESWIAELESGSSGGTDKRIQRNLVTHLASLKVSVFRNHLSPLYTDSAVPLFRDTSPL